MQQARAAVRGSKQQALWLATLGFFGGFAGVAIFGPLVPKFTKLLTLSPFQAALLTAIPTATGSLLRIPFGAVVDKLGGKKPVLLLLGVTNLGVIGLITLLATQYNGVDFTLPAKKLAPQGGMGTYAMLLVLGALIGFGIAIFSVGVAQVSYWFRGNEQGTALGFFGGLGNTSPGLSTLLLPLAVGAVGIVGAYSLWLALLLAITVAYALFMHDAPWFQLRDKGLSVPAEALSELGGGDKVPAGSAMEGLRKAAKVPATWMLTFFYFLSFGGFMAFTTWLPTYWQSDLHGETLRKAAVLTAVFSLLAAFVRAGAGFLTDRISIRHALLGNVILMFFGVLALSFSLRFSYAFLATLVIAFAMGLQNAVVFKLLPGFVPGAIGGASGWIGGLGALGGFILPPTIGAVTQAVGGSTGYARGFLPVDALVLLAIPVVIYMNRKLSATTD